MSNEISNERAVISVAFNHNIFAKIALFYDMIENIDEIIPFSKRHKYETVRQIIRADSGYLKDLFLNDSRLVFSPKCFNEICRLTAGHKDNWEKPKHPTALIFQQCKPYKVSYLYDFNDVELLKINNERLLNLNLYGNH